MDNFVDVIIDFDLETIKAVEDFAKQQGISFDEAVVCAINAFVNDMEMNFIETI